MCTAVSEMKECPFCGATPDRLEFQQVLEEQDAHQGLIRCMACDANGPISSVEPEQHLATESAYQKWNCRPYTAVEIVESAKFIEDAKIVESREPIEAGL